MEFESETWFSLQLTCQGCNKQNTDEYACGYMCHQVLNEDLFMNDNLLAKLLLLAFTFKFTLKENDVDC
jgi:hypothetical protein